MDTAPYKMINELTHYGFLFVYFLTIFFSCSNSTAWFFIVNTVDGRVTE